MQHYVSISNSTFVYVLFCWLRFNFNFIFTKQSVINFTFEFNGIFTSKINSQFVLYGKL